jgi:hypothetical protein
LACCSAERFSKALRTVVCRTAIVGWTIGAARDAEVPATSNLIVAPTWSCAVRALPGTPIRPSGLNCPAYQHPEIDRLDRHQLVIELREIHQIVDA